MEKNFKKFLLLWAGQLVSAIGGGLTSFGLGVYIFNQTGSAGKMAIITLIGFLPTLVLSVPAGALADRYDRRLLMMLGDGLSALGVIYILFCLFTGNATFTNICIGVAVSAIFSSLLEPAYRATVTDLLSKEEFAKASGLVSLAGSARYLVSPLLAGLLLAVCDVSVLLIIDTCTFFLTVITTFVVKKGLVAKEREDEDNLLSSIATGWKALTANSGVLILVLVSAILTLFIGVFQILAEPMVLSFTDAATLGVTETLCACGMLASSLFLGIKGMKKNYVRTLSLSLFAAGIFILFFGMWENVVLMTIFGFGFFMALPFANTCLDYLVRTNIAEELQGRVWGFIGFLSQIGYVIAYGVSGILSDYLAKTLNITVGRGAAMVSIAAGVLLVLTALLPISIKKVRGLEA